LIFLIATKLHRLLHKPTFLLDENIGERNGGLPKCQCILARQIVKPATPDDVLLEEANKRNLIIVTRDVKFVVKTTIKGKNIIYESDEGFRFLIPGKSTKIIDRVEPRSSIRWPTNKQKKIADLANRTPPILSLDGFYTVTSF
jgi:hypothetical protein